MIDGRPDLANIRFLVFKNTSGETIPAFGLMQPVGEEDDALEMDKPDTDGQLVYINGPADVADQAYGLCTRDTPFPALYDDADGTPAIGETWGAGNGTFELKKDNAGFTVTGDPADGRVKVVVVGSGGGGGSEIVVKETDGMPTVDPCDTIEFLSTHFKVTDLGDGKAKVEIINTGSAVVSLGTANAVTTCNTTTTEVVTNVTCSGGSLSVTKTNITYVSSCSSASFYNSNTTSTFFKP